jgi:PleD family two-component response regulator
MYSLRCWRIEAYTRATGLHVSCKGDDAESLRSRGNEPTSPHAVTREIMTQEEKPWRPFVVLIASDTEWGARSLDSVLQASGYAVVRAHGGPEAMELAISERPHAVILDTKTAGMPGIEVCRRLTGDPRFAATTPIIMTTSDGESRAERMEAYGAGAWELYPRPLDGTLLLLKLQTFMRAKRVSERWHEGSLVDAATGLYNMEGLARRAREIGAHAFRCREPLACVAFAPSTIADRAPEPRGLGRLVTEHVAEACLRNARSSDAVGRLSDSHFAFVAPATDEDGARMMVDRLRTLLEAGAARSDIEVPLVKIRAGYCATQNFAEATISAEDMLQRAVGALSDADGRDSAGVRL